MPPSVTSTGSEEEGKKQKQQEKEAGTDKREEEATRRTQATVRGSPGCQALLTAQQSAACLQSEPGQIVSEVRGYGGGPVYTGREDATHPFHYGWCDNYEY
jgi:hypothetical protein